MASDIEYWDSQMTDLLQQLEKELEPAKRLEEGKERDESQSRCEALMKRLKEVKRSYNLEVRMSARSASAERQDYQERLKVATENMTQLEAQMDWVSGGVGMKKVEGFTTNASTATTSPQGTDKANRGVDPIRALYEKADNLLRMGGTPHGLGRSAYGKSDKQLHKASAFHDAGRPTTCCQSTRSVLCSRPVRVLMVLMLAAVIGYVTYMVMRKYDVQFGKKETVVEGSSSSSSSPSSSSSAGSHHHQPASHDRRGLRGPPLVIGRNAGRR